MVSGGGPNGDVEALQRSWAGLLRVFEPPNVAVAQYVAQVGAVAAWRGIRDRHAPQQVLAPTSARTVQFTAMELEAMIDADLVAAAAVGARIIGAQDPEWPAAALVAFAMAATNNVSNAAPPVALYVRGRPLVNLPECAVSVVWSRANSPYGQRVAADLAMGLAAAGMTVISGAAFGIDTLAHRAALSYQNELPTLAVLACGIDRAYPIANTALIERIATVGAVVTEYPPDALPARHRFLVRNRLIAALSAGTVVVEAGRRSGTLSTASAASMLGRVLMAVPGPVTSALSVGCHLLISSAAALLVTGADEVIELLGSQAQKAALDGVGCRYRQLEHEQVRPTDDHPTDGLEPEVAKVYDALPHNDFRSVSELSLESALTASTVIASLAILELHDLVRRQHGSWRRRRKSDAI